MSQRKLQTGNLTALQRRIIREHFGIAPRTRGVDYSTLRNQFNNELTEQQRQSRNRKARERRINVKTIVENKKVIKAQKTLRKYFFKKALSKKIQARPDRRFLHTLVFDAYTRQQNGNSFGNFKTYLKYMGQMSIQFQSKFRHPLIPFVYTETIGLWNNYAHRNQSAVIDSGDAFDRFFDLSQVVTNAMNQIGGSDGRTASFSRINIIEIPVSDARLVDMTMYRELILSATPEFRGFVDSGDMECVPETILYHISRWEKRKNRRYSLGEIKNLCNDDKYDKGYNTHELVNCLKQLRCAYKLIDVEEKVFATNKDYIVDTNLPVFVAQVWNNHLYYCSDDDYIKSLASSESFKTSNREIVIKKKEKVFDSIVIGIDDLKDLFLQQFSIDNKFRKVSLYNSKIVGYELDNKKWIYANPDLELVKQVCDNMNISFKNQSLTFLGKGIFDRTNPKHKSSHFNDNVYSQLQINTGIVSLFNNTSGATQSSADINKCRTSCLLNNVLGDYPVFGIADDIQEYNGKMVLGWYYAITDNNLPMRGAGWYSNQFLNYCAGENIKFDIKYQLTASGKLSSNFADTFVKEIIKASPDNYKTLVNTTIGYFGKTLSKYSSGYLETDFKFACQKFWDNENVGTIYDLQDAVGISNRKRMRTDKFKCVDIGEILYENQKIYMVQQTNVSKDYCNDLPIYNKVLENEWIMCYELAKKLGGRLIKIKTDNVIVENGNPIEFSETIGGYKDETIKENYCELDIQFYKEPERVIPKVYLTERIWNKTPVEIGDADNYFEKLKPKLPKTSFCLTGLAGYGKSECVKKCDWYNDETTLKVAFTNKATESMSGETICSAFGIDFNTGLATQSKLNKCKNVKRIINDECFMTPSYAMSVFDLIHQKYPEIQFIFVGDPHQTRPVGEEKINWLNCSVFHTLCGGNLVELCENQRNDLSPEYFDIIEGRGININNFGKHHSSKINICRTNEYRKQINKEYMGETGVFIKYNILHAVQGQDVWLKKGTPIMSVVNNKERKLINSKMWVIEKIGFEKSFPECLNELGADGNIIIGGQSFTHTEFMKFFVVAFAFTNHKVQSITIKEKFVIHEWDKMSPREQYTAFSRTSSKSFVKIF